MLSSRGAALICAAPTMVLTGGATHTTLVLSTIVAATCHGSKPGPEPGSSERAGPPSGAASAEALPKLHSGGGVLLSCCAFLARRSRLKLRPWMVTSVPPPTGPPKGCTDSSSGPPWKDTRPLGGEPTSHGDQSGGT